MRLLTIVALLVVIVSVVVTAMDYSGWYRVKLDWEVADGLSFASVFSSKWQWTDTTRTSLYLALDDDGVHQLKLGSQWYDSPQRWRGRVNFTNTGFDYATLDWHYFKDPWDVEWESELDAGGPLDWDIDVSYSGDTMEWEVTVDFTGMLTFSSFTGVLTIPLPRAWHADLSLTMDRTQDPVFSPQCSLYSPNNTGKLTVKYMGITPTDVEFDRTWETEAETYELDVEWIKDNSIQFSYTYQYTAGNDIGSDLVLRATAGPPLTITQAEYDVYGADWYLYLDFIDQSIGFTVSRDLAFGLYLEVDGWFWLADDDQEIEAYLEWDNFSLDIDWSFTDGAPDELTITVKLYF